MRSAEFMPISFTSILAKIGYHLHVVDFSLNFVSLEFLLLRTTSFTFLKRLKQFKNVLYIFKTSIYFNYILHTSFTFLKRQLHFLNAFYIFLIQSSSNLKLSNFDFILFCQIRICSL